MGQILHDALIGGAVLNGQWWWVIPPGLTIAPTGTFATPDMAVRGIYRDYWAKLFGGTYRTADSLVRIL